MEELDTSIHEPLLLHGVLPDLCCKLLKTWETLQAESEL